MSAFLFYSSISTCHTPCFLPPTRLSKPFCWSFPIMNFTPPNERSFNSATVSSMVALGCFLKKSKTFFCDGSKFFWMVLLSFKTFFWVVESLFWIVLLSFKASFWIVVSLFWVVTLSFWVVLGIITLNSFAWTSFSNWMSGFSARIRTIPDQGIGILDVYQRTSNRQALECHCD